MEKIVQWEQENPAANGCRMIDDFRLRGSRTWRRMGGPLTRGGVAHGGGARGGASLQQPQRSTLRGRRPRRCGPGCAGESALDAGWHGLPESYGVKPRAVPRHGVHRLARRVVAPHGRGRKWRERPRVFCRWCATGEGEVVHAKIHHLPSPFRGRSLHSDPWREGHRALPRSGRINRPIRFPHRRRDLRSLRGKSVQEAFRGALVCQGVRKSSLPGKARGFRGGRTPSNASPSLLAPSRPRSWEREKGAAGVMEGPGESSPRSGVRRGRSPSPAPMYVHWVGWLPFTTRCGAGPAVPASHGARHGKAIERCRGQGRATDRSGPRLPPAR